MLKEEQELRWSAQTLHDHIQEESESSPTPFIGLCCNNTIGSPESVTASVDETVDIVVNNNQLGGSSQNFETQDGSVSDLRMGELALLRQTGTIRGGERVQESESRARLNETTGGVGFELEQP
jgi:hypothetical protein